jgi:hypothetical protein
VALAYQPGARRRAVILQPKSKLRDAAVKAVDAAIAPGLLADIIAVRGNPLDDICLSYTINAS